MQNANFDADLLPKRLRPLARLIAAYAESDDRLREELLEHATNDELAELRDAPAALWPEINGFLDRWVASPPGPYQDLALALDSFAQAAMEAAFALQRRDSPDR